MLDALAARHNARRGRGDTVLDAGHRPCHLVLLVGDVVPGAGADVGLVADRVHCLSHLAARLLYFLLDCNWVFAHFRSSFVLSIASVGTGAPVWSRRRLPARANRPAKAVMITVTTSAAAQAGIASARARINIAVSAPDAHNPSRAAAP